MTELGGPTTQSGIYYQNSIAALYLGRLCDPRDHQRSRHIVSVRIEAPEDVDDILVAYSDGSRRLIQAKEVVRESDEAWKRTWRSIFSQAQTKNVLQEEYYIVVGTYEPYLSTLREALDRARGKENSREWQQSLSGAQMTAINRLGAIVPDTTEEKLFNLCRMTTIEIRILADIEQLQVRDWMPLSNVSADTVFSHLRDLCGGRARVRKLFRPAELLNELYQRHNVKVADAPHSQVAEYRRAFATLYGRIVVPGTRLAGHVEDLFIWPPVLERQPRFLDFDDESPGDIGSEGGAKPIDLSDFPNKSCHRVVLHSGAGTGKSTILRAIGHRLATRSAFVPVYISPTFLPAYLGLLECLGGEVSARFNVTVPWDELCELGQIVLLLDGLDELDDSDRTYAIGCLEKFVARYPSVPYVLTVRDTRVLAPPDGAVLAEVGQLSDLHVSVFVKKYQGSHLGFDGDALLTSIFRNRELKQLARIPLYLALLVATAASRRALPSHRAELLESYLRVVLTPERFKDVGLAAPSQAAEQVREAGESIAAYALESNSVSIPEREALQRLRSFPGRPTEYLERLIEVGVVSLHGQRVAFAFPIVQEYLAACYLVREGANDIEARFDRIVRRPWAQTLQFAVELSKDADRIIQKQLKSDDDAFHTRLRLLSRCVVNGAVISGELRLALCDRLVDAWSSMAFSIRRSVGDLLSEGIADARSSKLRAALRLTYTGSDGRGAVLRRLGDAQLANEILEILLSQNDIRELWSADWRACLRLDLRKSIPALLARARQESGSTLATCVLSNVLRQVLVGESVVAREFCDDPTIPALVRLAGYRVLGVPMPADCWQLVDEAMKRADWWGAQGEELRQYYCHVDGWRDHFSGLVSRPLPEDVSLVPLLDLGLEEHQQRESFRNLLRSLLQNADGMPATTRMDILLTLMFAGEAGMTEIATAFIAEHRELWPRTTMFAHWFPPEFVIAQFRRVADSESADFVLQIAEDLEHSLKIKPRPVVREFREAMGGETRDAHPAEKDIVGWLQQTIIDGIDINTRLKTARLLLKYGGAQFGGELESAIRERLDDTAPMTDADWNEFGGAVIGADIDGYQLPTELLWRIIYAVPHQPVSFLIRTIAAREGQKAHTALIECFREHPANMVKVMIFEYFEGVAGRLGLRVELRAGELFVDGGE